MSKEIKVTCSIDDRVSIDDLVPTQKNLKSLSKENFEKLRKSIIKNGFFFPIGIWDHDGVLKLLDGHQRLLTLKELRNEGYIIPLVPVFRVYASDEKQAREMLLHSVSQYGHVEKQGLYELMIDWDISVNELEFFELPDQSLDVKLFNEEFFGEVKEIEFPELSNSEKSDFEQITFTLHKDQAMEVRSAMELAKNMGPFTDGLNENSNGNAITRICEIFVAKNE